MKDQENAKLIKRILSNSYLIHWFSKGLIVFFIFIGFASQMTTSGEGNTWNIDSAFSGLPPFDIEGRGLCVSVAPSQQGSWGIEAFLFDSDNNTFGQNTLDWYRFHNRENGVYLFGREVSGHWGLVRYIQGDVWGGSVCQTPINWYLPQPVPYQTIHSMEVNYQLDSAQLLSTDNSWVMVAANLWLNSLEVAKPLVIDLVFHHQCNNTADCKIRHFEDDKAFHYMIFVDASQPILMQQIIAEALATTYLNECMETQCVSAIQKFEMLSVYQFEFVIELHNSQASAYVQSLFLYLLD